MDFRELSYILAIAKYQNITKAAEALYVSQPTLSKFLISLERDLGQRLFRKVGHKYVLTYAGERYVERANEIIRIKNELDNELADIIKQDVGVLNVAIPQMRGTYMLPATLPVFRERHPNVRVNLIEARSDEIDRALLNGQVDVAFYSKPNNLNPNLEYETIKGEELLICVPKGHPVGQHASPNPFSRYPKLDPALLRDELLLRPMPDQRTRQITDDYFDANGLKFTNETFTSNISSIIHLVAAGYGVSFIFETHVKNIVGMDAVDCYSFGEIRTVHDFVASTRKGSYVSNYARDFIDITRQLFAESK